MYLSVIFAFLALAMNIFFTKISIGSIYGPFGVFSHSLLNAGIGVVVLSFVSFLCQSRSSKVQKNIRVITMLMVFLYFTKISIHFLAITIIPLFYFLLSRIILPQSRITRAFFIFSPIIVGLYFIISYAVFSQKAGTFYYMQMYFRGIGFFAHLFLWSIDRYIYQKKEANDFYQFADYFFHPLFLIVPSQLYMIPYSAFVKMRSSASVPVSQYIILCCKGIILTGIYPFLLTFSILPLWILIWISIYAQHVGIASIQILCGAGSGYWIPIDTKLPFLSRSYLEYFHRMHFYIRDCILHAFVLPLQLHLRRYGLGKNTAYIFSATIGYAWIRLQRIGPVPMAGETPLVSVPVFLIIFIFFVLLPSVLGSGDQKSSQNAALSDGELLRSIAHWSLRDIVGWLIQCAINIIAIGATAFLAIGK